MKRVLPLLALVLVACPHGPPTSEPANSPVPAGTAGASSPRAALESFLASIRAQDLQAMSIVWGTSKGPARDQMTRDYLEKAELTMQCLFAHDRFAVTGETRSSDTTRTLAVTLTKGNVTKSTSFSTVHGPANRWYVNDADVIAVGNELCRASGSPGKP
ncbi:MAG: hypothetical protein ACR2OG_15165 [Gemmatimonadaceae bacterium]